MISCWVRSSTTTAAPVRMREAPMTRETRGQEEEGAVKELPSSSRVRLGMELVPTLDPKGF